MDFNHYENNGEIKVTTLKLLCIKIETALENFKNIFEIHLHGNPKKNNKIIQSCNYRNKICANN